MILQVMFVDDLVDKAGGASPVVLRLRVREGYVPGEVFVLVRQPVEVIDVKRLTKAAGAVPKADLAAAVEALELVENVGRTSG